MYIQDFSFILKASTDAEKKEERSKIHKFCLHNLTFSATKYGLRGLMDALYLELQEQHPNSDIQLTVVHPFTVNTGLAKNPRTRFKSFIPITEPSEVASIVLKAVKRNEYEVYVPTRLFYLFSLAHLLPFKVKLALYKFAGCGVGSHE